MKRLPENNCIRKLTVLHCLESGLSYSIFDKEHRLERSESVATGGAVYWHDIDSDDLAIKETGCQRLLDAMNLPLVSFVLRYDKAVPLLPEVAATSARFIREHNTPER